MFVLRGELLPCGSAALGKGRRGLVCPVAQGPMVQCWATTGIRAVYPRALVLAALAAAPASPRGCFCLPASVFVLYFSEL